MWLLIAPRFHPYQMVVLTPAQNALLSEHFQECFVMGAATNQDEFTPLGKLAVQYVGCFVILCQHVNLKMYWICNFQIRSNFEITKTSVDSALKATRNCVFLSYLTSLHAMFIVTADCPLDTLLTV